MCLDAMDCGALETPDDDDDDPYVDALLGGTVVLADDCARSDCGASGDVVLLLDLSLSPSVISYICTLLLFCRDASAILRSSCRKAVIRSSPRLLTIASCDLVALARFTARSALRCANDVSSLAAANCAIALSLSSVRRSTAGALACASLTNLSTPYVLIKWIA